MRHQMSLGFWKPLLALFGGTRERSYVEVTEGSVRFRFGFYEETISRSAIETTKRSSWPLWAGIGWRIGRPGTLGLIGALEGVVEVRLSSPRPTKLLLIPLTLHRVFVSLEDPEGFLADLEARRA